MAKQKIGIIGAGNVGLAIGGALQRAGHDVIYGLREGSSSTADVVREGGTVATLAEASARDVILVAVPFRALQQTVDALGDLSGRIVLDATNPMGGAGPSGAEQLAAMARGARVVKAFNTTGFENMENAGRLAQKPMMPVCSDDAAAKELAMSLVRDAGFEAIDAGPLKNASLLETLAHLWVDLVRRGMGRDWAFAITRAK